eukprot:1769126-Rhodomonas_salina.1
MSGPRTLRHSTLSPPHRSRFRCAAKRGMGWERNGLGSECCAGAGVVSVWPCGVDCVMEMCVMLQGRGVGGGARSPPGGPPPPAASPVRTQPDPRPLLPSHDPVSPPDASPPLHQHSRGSCTMVMKARVRSCDGVWCGEAERREERR